MNTQTIFTCRVELVLDIKPDSLPVLQEVNYDLRLPKPGPLNKDLYLDTNEMPTAGGIKMISNALIHGLAANIKAGDTMSLWKPEDHIEWVFNELKRAIATDASEFVPGTNKFRTSD